MRTQAQLDFAWLDPAVQPSLASTRLPVRTRKIRLAKALSRATAARRRSFGGCLLFHGSAAMVAVVLVAGVSAATGRWEFWENVGLIASSTVGLSTLTLTLAGAQYVVERWGKYRSVPGRRRLDDRSDTREL